MSEMSSKSAANLEISREIVNLAISGDFKKNHLRLIWLLAKHQEGAATLPLKQTLTREKICFHLNLRNSDLGEILKELASLQIIELRPGAIKSAKKTKLRDLIGRSP